MAWQPLVGRGHLTVKTLWLLWHATLSRLLWMSDRPNTETSTQQHTTLTETDSYAPSTICIWNHSKWAAADPHLRQHDHWDRHFVTIACLKWTAYVLKRIHGICCRLYFKITIYNIFMCKITNKSEHFFFSPHYSHIVYGNW